MIGMLKTLFTNAFAESGKDNVGLLAAGVAYYAFLAIVPLLAVIVLSYGLVVDPETVARHINALAEMLPSEATALIGEQLEAVVTTSSSKKGLGLAIAFAIALFGARNGAGAVVIAIGLAYNQPNTRSFVRGNLVAVAVTLGAIVGAGLTIVATTILTALQAYIPELGGAAALFGTVATYSLLLTAAILGTAVLYRFAPCGKRPKWHMVRPGALFAGTGLMLLTLLFGIYVANFGNYNATYGSLSAPIVLLTWLFLTAYVLLFGAELNAAYEDMAPAGVATRDEPDGETSAGPVEATA